ncbi:MAG: hypothetical protein IPK68_02150 [Bdellovibrionales bacterium]|nr:hypothetical protein [Bdellovibrionales bacterium]
MTYLKPVFVAVSVFSLTLWFQNCSAFKMLPNRDVLNTSSEIQQPSSPEGESSELLKSDECLKPNESWVFCNGFEEPTSDAQHAVWDDYDGNSDPQNAWIKNPGPFNISDNQIHRLRVPEGRGGADLIKVLPQEYDKLYARWYVQWEDGYDFSAPNHGSGLHAGSRGLMGVAGDIPNGRDFFHLGSR